MKVTIKQALLGLLLLGSSAVWSAPLANPATTVSLTSPSDGQAYVAPATVELSVQASAASGATIRHVDYYRGTTRIARVTTPPYSHTWNTAAAGSYSLTAKVTDDKNGSSTSEARTITIKANDKPTVSLSTPEAGQIFYVPANIPLTADASDSDGTITKVDFYQGNTLIGTATSAPYTMIWNDVGTGNYKLKAKATDDKGGVTTSAVQGIQVKTASPTIQLTSPSDGQAYVAPATVELSAEASAASGATIKHVDYYRGTTRIARVTTPPYGHTWNTVSAGTYSLTAKVTDDKNGSSTSEPRTITIKANDKPTINLVTPEAGQTYYVPANITLTADASDSDGTITKVDFYQGSTLIGTVTSAPYSFVWNDVGTGNYKLKAKATDDKGGVTTSETQTITVKTASPTIQLTSPSDGQAYVAPATVELSAEASAASGATIKHVDYYRGTTRIARITTPPYGHTWNTVSAGTYSLTAKVTDDKNGSSTSEPRTITIKANDKPTIDLLTPASGQNFAAPANITLSAEVSDSDGTITKVDFYQGNTLIGTATSAPYTMVWNDVGTGNYKLKAKATDDKGGTTTSIARSITVKTNQAPVIELTGPAAGQHYTAPANILLTATSSDSDGAITKVDFYSISAIN
jgi:hypothetical protein